jgi:hypothetical protein
VLGVGVVDLAEQNGYGLLQEDELWGMLFMGHLGLLWSGNQMALFLPHQPRNTHLEEQGWIAEADDDYGVFVLTSEGIDEVVN